MLAVREVSPVETGIFFWTFVVIIGFILFNMVLAVIFTVYDEKYGEIKKEEDGKVAK
jgi:predicted membrane protein